MGILVFGFDKQFTLVGHKINFKLYLLITYLTSNHRQVKYVESGETF